jgi:hypothetical protein
MAKQLSLPMIIILVICLVSVTFHFISDEMGLGELTGLTETGHHDNFFLLPGVDSMTDDRLIVHVPPAPQLPTQSYIPRSVSPPPNLPFPA